MSQTVQRKGKTGRFLAVFLLTTLVGACLVGFPFERPREFRDDLALAEIAIKERDIGDAEMYFERYLRKNADGIRRWEVWQQLLTISEDIRQDKGTAREYLEIMLLEFEDDAPRRQWIQMKLADLSRDMRDYPRAVVLWEALATDPDLPSEHLAEVYRELSHAYLRRLEFTLATDVLNLCLQLDVQTDTKADCLYALAETQMLTDELAASEKALRDLLSLFDASPDRRVLATFMLADVLEQQDKLKEAEELFESIRGLYPNGKVVEIRLGALKSKNGGRK